MKGILQKYTLSALLFLIPTQLALHFWPSWAYIFGLRVDFLAPAIYLTDILVIFLIVLNLHIFRPFVKYLVIFAILTLLNTLYSVSPYETLYKWFKVSEILLFAVYVAKQELISLKHVAQILFFSAAAFSVIGIFQFFIGRTIGGLLYWLGERSFSLGTPGIALVSLNGIEHLRAYSTFSHPNSLAGFLGAVLILALTGGTLRRSRINIAGVFIISLGFILTFSVSAYFGLLVVLFFIILRKNKKMFKFAVWIFYLLTIVTSLLMPIFSQSLENLNYYVGSNIRERADLAYMAGQMISDKFWLGEGLGSFIVNIPDLKYIHTNSWLLQPVHNIYLLVFSEIGIFGLIVVCAGMYKIFRKVLRSDKLNLVLVFLFVIFTGLFDHYWLTLQQNLLLISVLVGVSWFAPSTSKG